MTENSIAENIVRLKRSIEEAAQKAHRNPNEIRFILVSKTVDTLRIQEAFRAGVRDFGENRVQELAAKKKELPSEIKWHMIGHLQTNKVRQVVGEVVLLHSLDRPELLMELERQSGVRKIGEIPCLIQVKSSEEPSKFGLDGGKVADFVSTIKKDSPVRIRGLMTIGPLTEISGEIRAAFRRVKNLRDDLKKRFPDKDWGILSMGMSSDYPIAIEEGANLLRVGTAVFGPRFHPGGGSGGTRSDQA